MVCENVSGLKLSYNDTGMSLEVNILDYGISLVFILQAEILRFRISLPNEYQGKWWTIIHYCCRGAWAHFALFVPLSDKIFKEVVTYSKSLSDICSLSVSVRGYNQSLMHINPGLNMSIPEAVVLAFIPYYGLFICDIQVSDLQMEINQGSGDQSI